MYILYASPTTAILFLSILIRNEILRSTYIKNGCISEVKTHAFMKAEQCCGKQTLGHLASSCLPLLQSSHSCWIKLFQLASSFGNELHPSFQTSCGLVIQLKVRSEYNIRCVSKWCWTIWLQKPFSRKKPYIPTCARLLMHSTAVNSRLRQILIGTP